MKQQYILWVLFGLAVILRISAGSGSHCQDISRSTCLAMAAQNPRMCAEPTLATSVCPSFCNRCPLTCYNCETTTGNVTHCNTISCAADEMCLLTTTGTTSGTLLHKLSCDTHKICTASKKRNQHFGPYNRVRTSRDISMRCCDRDLCNAPQQTTTPTTVTTTTPSTTPPTPTPTVSYLLNIIVNVIDPCSKTKGDDDDDFFAGAGGLEDDDGHDGCGGDDD